MQKQGPTLRTGEAPTEILFTEEGADEQCKKEDKAREDIPVKTTSTHFIDDKKGIFTPRQDARSANGNADKSTSIIDKE